MQYLDPACRANGLKVAGRGNDRNLMFMLSLEEAKEAFVRIVDTFADAIDYMSFGFGKSTFRK